MTVEEAAPFVRLGRSSAYEAARRGEIPTIKFGRSIRVPPAKLRQILGIDPEPGPDSPIRAEVMPLRKDSA